MSEPGETITLAKYLGSMPIRFPHEFTDQIEENAKELLSRVNALLEIIPEDRFTFVGINSGWRPAAYNANVPGAAKNSKHMTAQAVDISDPDGDLDDVLFKNQEVLEEFGLWMEHPSATKGWCHLQCVSPRSGNRVFYP